MPVPFYRTTLLVRGLRANRRTPDVDGLRAEGDPERFLWRVLPHAARSFAASIVVLPPPRARAAAVAYLYCRMLDTYEDLAPAEERGSLIEGFAERFATEVMPPALPITSPKRSDRRDQIGLLLLARSESVDEVYAALPPGTRASIADLVRRMAKGMVWSSEVFDRHGGILSGEDQVSAYCRNVIGEPVVFAIELVGDEPLTPEQHGHARAASEMIQLANVTRDIEKDLDRGIAYDEMLRPFLGGGGDAASRAAAVRSSRSRHMAFALRRAPSFRHLFEGFRPHGPSTRVAALLMLLFTDLHYRKSAVAVGAPGWRGPRGSTGTVLRALPAAVSHRYATRTVRRVEREFLAAADRLESVLGPDLP